MQKTPIFHSKIPTDRQQMPPSALCAQCGGELYGWETTYLLDDEIVCIDCLSEYARAYFSPHLKPLDEIILEVIHT